MLYVGVKFCHQLIAGQFFTDAAPQMRLMKFSYLAIGEGHPYVAGVIPRILVFWIDFVAYLASEFENAWIGNSRLRELIEPDGSIVRRHGNAEWNAELGGIRRRRPMFFGQRFPKSVDCSFAHAAVNFGDFGGGNTVLGHSDRTIDERVCHRAAGIGLERDAFHAPTLAETFGDLFVIGRDHG